MQKKAEKAEIIFFFFTRMPIFNILWLMLEIEIVEVSVTQMGFALMLKPPMYEKVVPIFIGPLETYSISSALEGQKPERPLTHDLMKSVMTSAGYTLEKVIVDEFKNGTFFAKLFIRKFSESAISNGLIKIDARPSDAIALAIRFEAPIYMSDHVYAQTAVDFDLIKDKAGITDERQNLSDEFDFQTDDTLQDDEKDELIQTILEEFGDMNNELKQPVEKKKIIKTSQSKSKEEKYLSKEDVLRQMLRTAISLEKYEDAASLRDELQKLKDHQHDDT